MNLLAFTKSPVIVFIAALNFGLMASVIFYPVVRSKVAALVSFKKRKLFKYDMTVQALLNHPVLSYLSLQQTGIKHLVFDDPGHTETIKDMLNIYFATYKKAIKDFITQGVVLTDKYAFKKLVENTILLMDNTCDEEWSKLDFEGKEGLIKSFQAWQQRAAGFLNRAIMNVTVSNIYDNNIERLQEILSLLQAKLDMTLPDIDQAFGVPRDKTAGISFTA